VEKYRKPHGQLKENLFLPLFNTNFISKFEINAFEINAGKGTSHFNPLEDYRFVHHWFSGVKIKRRNNGRKLSKRKLSNCRHHIMVIDAHLKHVNCVNNMKKRNTLSLYT
jgi:hypothetical protein